MKPGVGDMVHVLSLKRANIGLLPEMSSVDPNTLAGNNWLWAEYEPDGFVFYSVSNQGAGCVGCHSLEQGPENDYVRTFERQKP